jgi:hypothetical protein
VNWLTWVKRLILGAGPAVKQGNNPEMGWRVIASIDASASVAVRLLGFQRCRKILTLREEHIGAWRTRP